MACPTFTQVTPTPSLHPHTHYGRLARTYLASITPPYLIPFNTGHVSHLELHEQNESSHHNGRGTTKAQGGFQGQQQYSAEQVKGTNAQEITHRFVRDVYYYDTGQFFLLSLVSLMINMHVY